MSLVKYLLIDNSIARNNWVIKKLEEIWVGEDILDAGAGEQRYRMYCSHLIYTSQDFGEYEWNGNNIWLQTGKWDTSSVNIISDIIDIPLEAGGVSNILCTEVLEHIPYPDRAIKEFARLLKSEWKLILTAPFCSLTHFAPYYFCNGFSEYWYKKILEENGFQIIEIQKNGNYFDFLHQEIIRVGMMAKTYCNASNPLVFFIRIIGLLQILVLKYLSRRSTWSEDILNFWIHILAKKI